LNESNLNTFELSNSNSGRFFFLLPPGPPILLHAGPHFPGQTTPQGCSTVLCYSTAPTVTRLHHSHTAAAGPSPPCTPVPPPPCSHHVASKSTPPLYSSTELKRVPSPLSHPCSEKMKLKPLYVCPRCLNHTYSNNMVNKYNISIKLQAKIFTK
jgi:hypothetical protein